MSTGMVTAIHLISKSPDEIKVTGDTPAILVEYDIDTTHGAALNVELTTNVRFPDAQDATQTIGLILHHVARALIDGKGFLLDLTSTT